MTYYRVPASWDNKTRVRPIAGHPGHYAYNGIWIGGELYTRRELERRGAAGALAHFEEITISKRRVYWFFGARFAKKEA